MTVPSIAPAEGPRKHKWGEPVSVMDGTPSGCQETERVCVLCEMVKITVHPPEGLPWRAWRTRDGMRAEITATPPCNGVHFDAGETSPASAHTDSNARPAPADQGVGARYPRNSQGGT